MAVKYELYACPENLTTNNKKGEYYPRVITNDTAKINDIVNLISERSCYSAPTVIGCLSALSEVLSETLKSGRKVQLPGIGYFGLSIESEKPVREMNARNIRIKLKNVTYQPDAELRKSLADTEFRCTAREIHIDMLTEEQWEELVTDFLKDHSSITISDLVQLSKASRTSTWRHIKEWVIEGRIENVGTARRQLFIPTKNNFGK